MALAQVFGKFCKVRSCLNGGRWADQGDVESLGFRFGKARADGSSSLATPPQPCHSGAPPPLDTGAAATWASCQAPVSGWDTELSTQGVPTVGVSVPGRRH